MADNPIASLLFLEAIKVRDPDGADELQVVRDGIIVERIRIRKDEVFTFEDGLGHTGRLIPFGTQAAMDITLFEVDENGPDTKRIGSTIIGTNDLGQGELTRRIAGEGSEFVLTYKVI